MTEKELHKLSRQDLLHLLVAQGREANELQDRLDDALENLRQSTESNERLKKRINEREEQIQHLKEKLDAKDQALQGMAGGDIVAAGGSVNSSAYDELKASNERLIGRLDERESQIKRLKSRLDEKDIKIRSLETEMDNMILSRKVELEEAGSIAEASLRMSGIFEAAQEAADIYLENIRRIAEERGVKVD